ncbi:MAG TPA: NAD(+) diphosphatase [Dehalococcoidales bacterium]|nr:NAD(+) diphosphatase [Dehalococcoidales bacterium]
MERESLYKNFVPAKTPSEEGHGPAYWLAFSSSRLLVHTDTHGFSLPYVGGLEELNLSAVRVRFLGTFRQRPCYAAELSDENQAPNNFTFTDLRSFYSGADEDVFLLAGRSYQIILWEKTNHYCGRCGHLTETAQAEWAKICPSCKSLSYPHIAPAVIVGVLKDNQILLTRYSRSRVNMHTIIAGFLEPGETLEECVRREVLEEVGIKVKNIRYFGSQPWPFPNSVMIGFTAEYESGEIKPDGTEIAEAGWYSAGSTPVIPPKMSISREIIDWFMNEYSIKAKSD